jgi:ribosomal protein S27E
MSAPRVDAACDFCTRRFPGLWVFRCAPFQISLLNGISHSVEGLLYADEQPMGACDECMAAIDAEDLDALLSVFQRHGSQTANPLVRQFHAHAIAQRRAVPEKRYRLAAEREPGARFFEWKCPKCGKSTTFDTSSWIDEHTSGSCPFCGVLYDLYGKPEAKGANS